MSSDSEEEFQSADEGSESDLDLKDNEGSTSQKPIPDVHTEKDVTSLSSIESPKLSDSENGSHPLEKISTDRVPVEKNLINLNRNSENSDQAIESLAISVDNINLSLNDDSSITKRKSDIEKTKELQDPERIEVSTSSKKNIEHFDHESEIEKKAVCNRAAVDTSIPQPIPEPWNSTEKLHAPLGTSSIDTVTQTLKDEILKNKAGEDAGPTSAPLDICKACTVEEIVGDANSAPKVFQRQKTSRIGLKKPREKLGERLGSKRLGEKISKPLESISCDTLSQEVKLEEKTEASTAQKSPAPEPNDQDASGTVDTGWGGAWGGWGSTIINAASTLTQEVGRGVGSVVELVEEGIGVPSPEELAKEQLERERMLKLWDDWGDRPPQEVPEVIPSAASVALTDSAASREDANTKSSFAGLGFGGLTSLVSGVSGALESAGSKVVYGGLDTLELIGRHTMDVLHDTDPGLRAKKDRFLERVNKPNLSAVLREAREQAVANPSPDPDSPSNFSGASSSRISFSCLWTNSTGPAHLEALALIARQCTASTRDVMASLPAHARDQVDDTNSKIMALSEIQEENLTESSIFAERVSATIRDLHLPLNADNIAQCWSDLTTISEQYSEGSVSLLEAVASVEAGGSTVETNLIGGCVALVERLVAVAHKAAELSLISGEDQDPVTLAANFRELAVLGGSQLESCADAVCAGLSSTPQQEQLTPVITNIYMQVCEGSSCLQQSLVHLCTTLQLVVAQRAAASSL